MPNCNQCSTEFEITDKDRKFYKKMDIPPASLCRDCKQQRLMAFRNERTFYRRKCSQCNKDIISIFSADADCPVYCGDCWWGDGWDPISYGRDFDFNRPFFDQLRELSNAVPQLFIINAKGENVDYSNYNYRSKNCYLLISSDDCEDCHFGNYLWNCKDCLDSLYNTKCTLCYELIDSHNCYHCMYSHRLENCSNCLFSFDMQSCENCFGCAGLRQKKYHWFNEQVGEEEYSKRINELKMTPEEIELIQQKFQATKDSISCKYANLVNCENCTGDNLKDSKNSTECYDSYDLEDSKNIINGPGLIRDCYDFCGCKELESSIGGISAGGPGINLRFSYHAWAGCSDITYSAFSVSSHDLFGCVGLRHKEYCILNKQYTKEEYEELIPKIIDHMKNTNEWGDFFPIHLSHFAYNETLAQEYFPLIESKVENNGWKWKKPNKIEYQPQIYEVPSAIIEVTNDILKEVLACKECGKNFKVISQELKFYRQNNIPIPNSCPECRHHRRLEKRNPQKLYTRKCQKCDTAIQTTYAPDRPEKVYCEQCYLKEVY